MTKNELKAKTTDELQRLLEFNKNDGFFIQCLTFKK